MTRRISDWLNAIPKNWEKKRLKDVGYLYGGLTGKSGEDFQIDDRAITKPYIPFTNILNNVYVDPLQVKYVVMSDEEQQNRVEKGDLLFLMSSEDYESIGKAAVVRESLGEVYLNSFCKGFRVTDKKIYSPFLCYQLLGEESHNAIRIEAQGFTRINIQTGRISSANIAIPPYDEQVKIVNYLDSKLCVIDSNIEHWSEELEKLKIFKQAKINEAVKLGLKSNVSLKESGVEWIGKIPAQWGIFRIKYNTFLKGRIGWQGLNSGDFLDEGYYLITGTDFDNKGGINWDTCYRISEERFMEDTLLHVHEGDLLMTKDGTVGKMAYIKKLPDKASLNSHLLIIRQLTSQMENRYLYWVMLSDIFKHFCSISQTGAIMSSIGQGIYERFVAPMPSNEEQLAIADYLDRECELIDQKSALIQKQIENLQLLKRAMVNELVTGKRQIQ